MKYLKKFNKEISKIIYENNNNTGFESFDDFLNFANNTFNDMTLEEFKKYNEFREKINNTNIEVIDEIINSLLDIYVKLSKYDNRKDNYAEIISYIREIKVKKQ